MCVCTPSLLVVQVPILEYSFSTLPSLTSYAFLAAFNVWRIQQSSRVGMVVFLLYSTSVEEFLFFICFYCRRCCCCCTSSLCDEPLFSTRKSECLNGSWHDLCTSTTSTKTTTSSYIFICITKQQNLACAKCLPCSPGLGCLSTTLWKTWMRTSTRISNAICAAKFHKCEMYLHK